MYTLAYPWYTRSMTPPPTPPRLPATLVRQALVLLHDRGHAKGMGTDAFGRVCAVGAVTIMANEYRLGSKDIAGALMARVDALNVLAEVACEQFPERVPPALAPELAPLLASDARPLVCINDHPDTTPEDVYLIFEKAAIRLEESVTL